MNSRVNWEDSLNNFSHINLKWTQGVLSINYSVLENLNESTQMVNHYEFNRELCNKAYLLENLQTYFYVLSEFFHKSNEFSLRVVEKKLLIIFL